MISRRQFIKRSVVTILATLCPFIIKKRIPKTTHVDVDNLMAGGTIRLYSGSAPPKASDRHGGKLIATWKVT